jgi:hypothetical protein
MCVGCAVMTNEAMQELLRWGCSEVLSGFRLHVSGKIVLEMIVLVEWMSTVPKVCVGQVVSICFDCIL